MKTKPTPPPEVLGSPSCCASLGDNSACGANPPKSERQIIAEAQRERLNHGLRTLASWCASRAMLEHDTETTLTMLEKKAGELRGKCMKAGWAAINEHSQHNVQGHRTGGSPFDVPSCSATFGFEFCGVKDRFSSKLALFWMLP